MELNMDNVRRFVVETVAGMNGVDPCTVADNTLVPDLIGMLTIAQFEFPQAPSWFAQIENRPHTVAEAVDILFPPGMRAD